MLKKLYVEPSSACNLNCRMCFRHNWFNEKTGLMNGKTVKKVLEIFKNKQYSHVFFGGMGEPLMHPDIVSMVNEASLCGKKVEIITNATLLTEEVTKKLLAAGIDTLWVSLDGFSKESYEAIRKGSLYSLVEKNISYFAANKGAAKLGITFVMMKENEYELENINAFADKIGVDFINLSHVVPNEELPESEAIYEKNYPVGKMSRFTKEGHKKPENFCPFIQDGASFIRWDGEVCPCMQLIHSSYSYLYTEKRKIHKKSYGNINDKNFFEIWESEEYKSFRRRVLNFEFPDCTICLGCGDREENLKDCMYNIKPTCGACLWAQGIIRCP